MKNLVSTSSILSTLISTGDIQSYGVLMTNEIKGVAKSM